MTAQTDVDEATNVQQTKDSGSAPRKIDLIRLTEGKGARAFPPTDQSLETGPVSGFPQYRVEGDPSSGSQGAVTTAESERTSLNPQTELSNLEIDYQQMTKALSQLEIDLTDLSQDLSKVLSGLGGNGSTDSTGGSTSTGKTTDSTGGSTSTGTSTDSTGGSTSTGKTTDSTGGSTSTGKTTDSTGKTTDSTGGSTGSSTSSSDGTPSGHYTTSDPPPISGSSTSGSGEDGNTSDIKLSSTVQNVVDSLGLKANLSGSVQDNLTGYTGSGTDGKAMSAYGATENANGTVTIDKDPSHWGGDLAPIDSATGTQLFVADVKYNQSDIGKATFDGGDMSSWPAVWGLSGESSTTKTNQEIDAMEDFGAANGAKQAGSTLHNWTQGAGHPGSTAESSTIPLSDLADSNSANGVEVAALVDKQNDTITTYVGGKETAEWKVAADSPALTTPMNWILGTGNGEDFTVENEQLYTAPSSTVTKSPSEIAEPAPTGHVGTASGSGSGSTSSEPGGGNTKTLDGGGSSDSGSGSTASGDGNTSDIKLGSTLQDEVNKLGLKANLSGSVDDEITGFGSDGDKAYELSDYGNSNADGTFTEDKQPGPYGNVTTKDAATGTQLFVANVKFNPEDVGKENSWPAVWGLSGWNEGSPLNQEVDAMEYFGKEIDPSKLAGSTLHNWNKDDKAASTDETATIPTDLFDDADTTGVQVGALIDKQNDTITTYVDGQETADWKVAADSPALTTPMYWLLGTGVGEDMDIENVQLYTPSASSVTAYKPESSAT